jgi:hypothetical protein
MEDLCLGFISGYLSNISINADYLSILAFYSFFLNALNLRDSGGLNISDKKQKNCNYLGVSRGEESGVSMLRL